MWSPSPFDGRPDRNHVLSLIFHSMAAPFVITFLFVMDRGCMMPPWASRVLGSKYSHKWCRDKPVLFLLYFNLKLNLSLWSCVCLRIVSLFIAHRRTIKVRQIDAKLELPWGSSPRPAGSLTSCKLLILPQPLFFIHHTGLIIVFLSWGSFENNTPTQLKWRRATNLFKEWVKGYHGLNLSGDFS